MNPETPPPTRGRRWHVWFVYASLVFVVIYLARTDLIHRPTVRSPLALWASLPPLILTFVGVSASWRRVLRSAGIHAGLGECMASSGLSVFGKYIPGKFWLVVGRAAYVRERRGGSLATLSAASLNDQLVAVWVGLALGVVGLLVSGDPGVPLLMAIGAWLALSAVIFTPVAHHAAEKVFRRIFGREIVIPILDGTTMRGLLPWVVGYWLLLTGGFHLFVVGLTGDAPPAAGLGFPLGATVGTAALLVPGGLGVREGILVAYLVRLGLSLEVATTVAVASRLWFLFGEAAFFGLGLLAHRTGDPGPPESHPGRID